MLTIVKMRPDPVVDFAAEELKKYLRMMMPEAGDVAITLDPQGTEGFRLGLLSDFGLPFTGSDPLLDDEVYVETTEEGGILAGSNPRSVLYAVYRLLKLNGCRWLLPGVDGEYIPMKDIEPQKYTWLASHRIRGHCNEGAEYQQSMLEVLDFFPKMEINTISIEFKDPFVYYHRYYDHIHNQTNRPSERVSHTQTVQWKRQCECEMAKRGLMFHDIGHGWTAEPFGLNSSDGWNPLKPVEIREDQKQYLALLNGKRELHVGSPLKTNVCMSNPVVQEMMATSIADYAANHQNETYLAVALADSSNTQCECEECQKGCPSEFFVQILNRADEIMTERGLSTKIKFPAYHDTLIPPKYTTIKNPDRFILEYAPITRSYTKSITEKDEIPEVSLEYVRNQFIDPPTAEENFAYLREWQKIWKGPITCFEYHFWIHMCNDPGLMALAKRIYEDIQSLDYMGISGFVEDASQRAFFPHGFAMYLYAAALFDDTLSFDAIAEDYFSHAYGEDWKDVLGLMNRISEIFDFAYMEGERSADPKRGNFYNPDEAKRLEKVPELCAEERAMVAKHMNMNHRIQTVSWRMLHDHATYVEGLAKVIAAKAEGKDALAKEMVPAFLDKVGKFELQWEKYYDHFLAGKNIIAITNKVGKQVE